jgi:hypothetical protein
MCKHVLMSQCSLRMCIAQIINFELGVVIVADHFYVNAVTRQLGKSTIAGVTAGASPEDGFLRDLWS